MAAMSMRKDLRRDWRRWNRAERIIATLLGALLAFALPLALVRAEPEPLPARRGAPWRAGGGGHEAAARQDRDARAAGLGGGPAGRVRAQRRSLAIKPSPPRPARRGLVSANTSR